MPRRVTVDTTEAQSFEPTKPGPYSMNVDEIGDPEKSKNDNLMVWVHFAFNDPKLAKLCGRVSKAYVLEGPGAGFFREFWKAATKEDIPVDTKVDVDLDLAVKKQVVVDVGNEEYEGRLRNSVNRVAAAA